MHMDLVYDHPPLPTYDISRKGPIPKIPVDGGGYYHAANYHCNRLVPRPQSSAPRRFVDDTKPRRWQWYGSVCHSLAPAGTWPLARHYRSDEPCLDVCGGCDPLCYVWGGETPAQCFVGALGWLRVCRRAYAEGVEVLYATNTFRIRDVVILRRVRELFVPYRWASVRRLEVVWCVRPWGPKTPGCDDLETYQAALGEMPEVLAGLETLYVSLQGGMGRNVWPPPPMAEGLTYEEKMARRGHRGVEDVLGPMEAMMGRLPATVACNIAVPSSMYVLLRDEAVREGRTVERACSGQMERCWKEKEGRGYWLRLGQADMVSMRVPMVCMMGGWLDDDTTPEEDKVLYSDYHCI